MNEAEEVGPVIMCPRCGRMIPCSQKRHHRCYLLDIVRQVRKERSYPDLGPTRHPQDISQEW